METPALAIAFFYSIGTAAGGIAGPLLFAKLVDTKSATQVAIGFAIGAVLMIGAGVVELFLGISAEGRSLEDIAQPLTAEDAAGEASGPGPGTGTGPPRRRPATAVG